LNALRGGGDPLPPAAKAAVTIENGTKVLRSASAWHARVLLIEAAITTLTIFAFR
jgi:hypothetical protein